MFYRNRLLFGVVKTVVTTVWQVAYGLVCFLNLQPALIVILLWVLLHFTGVTEKYSISTALLSVALVFSLVFAVFTCIKQLLGLDKKPKERRGAEKIKPKKAENLKKETQPWAQAENETAGQTADIKTDVKDDALTSVSTGQNKPKYYRVKQNSSLIMAEYLDKYELYKIVDGKLVKLRTDYK